MQTISLTTPKVVVDLRGCKSLRSPITLQGQNQQTLILYLDQTADGKTFSFGSGYQKYQIEGTGDLVAYDTAFQDAGRFIIQSGTGEVKIIRNAAGSGGACIIIQKTGQPSVNQPLSFFGQFGSESELYVDVINGASGTVTFTNGEVIKTGEVSGDVSESDMRRIQIRETILSHFEKEEKLFNMGIKSLSLFFIDEVSKYRQYDADGNEILGEYGRIFEEEYLIKRRKEEQQNGG